MSAVLDPITDPQSWDTCFVGPYESPGWCEVSGFERAYAFDIKKGKGAFGGTVTFVQRPPATGQIKFWLWLPRHFDEWDDFMQALKYDPTKKTVTALDIYHPALAEIFITSVVCTSIGQLHRESGGYYSRVVKLLEYFPPPPVSAVSTPKTSIAATTLITTDKPSIGSPLDPAIKKAEEQLRQLLAGKGGP